MTNKRKGKIIYSLWLTPKEEETIIIYLKNTLKCGVGEIIQEANERGDFNKR